MSKVSKFSWYIEDKLQPIIDKFNTFNHPGAYDHAGITLFCESNGDSAYIHITKEENVGDTLEITKSMKVRASNHQPSSQWEKIHGESDMYIFIDKTEYTPFKLYKLIIKMFKLEEFEKQAKKESK